MVDEAKTLLTHRNPIAVTIGLDQVFGKKDEFGLCAYRPHQVLKEKVFGAQAMLIVGYSEQYHAVNSRGEGWGDQGFVS